MEPVTYAPAYKPQASPLDRLAWSASALGSLSRELERMAYADVVRETYARLGLPVPTGLLA